MLKILTDPGIEDDSEHSHFHIKSMKTSRWFSHNRFLSYLRFAFAVTLMSAAAAMTFVSTAPPTLRVAGKSAVDQDAFSKFNKFRQDPDQLLGSRLGLPGVERDGGPLLAAEQDYANRAYPATEIPFSATLNAQTAFKKVKTRSSSSPSSNIGTWTLIGPSPESAPALLTFNGAPAFYSGRITALAIGPSCTTNSCTVWVGAAGGGIWKTDNALAGSPTWTFVSGSFGTNAIGTLVYDAAHTTLYAGTGEPNASGDSEAGVGIYKSTDGGTTWAHLTSTVTALTTPGNGTYTGDAFAGRSIGSIVPDPNNANVLYVSSTRGVRGISSVTGGGTTNPPTPRPPFGLFKSTDGGATFTFIWDGNATIRGVNHVELDPNYATNNTLYAAAFQQGIWRSADNGSTWTQIYTPLVPNENTDRAEFAVTLLGNGKTRMYVGDGSTGVNTNPLSKAAQFYRSDDVATGAPTFALKSSTDRLNPYYATNDYCTGQCWYDNLVITPPGHPDVVYLAGSFQYGFYGLRSNGQAVLYSDNAGEHFYDATWDSTTNPLPPGQCCATGNTTAANGIHPDQHALIVSPGNPGLFFEGSDGGLVRSDGTFTDISSQCDSRPLSAASNTACHNMLAKVPTTLSTGVNAGLSTLQFQSVSYNPLDPLHSLQGGTQDNGTMVYAGSTTWNQEIYGDGGQSGFDAVNPAHRFNTFFANYTDANFQNGDPSKWVVISGPLFAEASQFYKPIIADPTVSGTIFVGEQSVWRTQDWGGDQTYLEGRCPEFTTSGADPACGDFVQIGPSGATDLTVSNADYRGTTRSGGLVAAVARQVGNPGNLWVATSAGRVFISKNANGAAGSVTFTRLDSLPGATAAPGRFVTSIYIDPSNSNHAWISYSGYNFNTPSQPGHVFEVTYNPNAGNATWANLDGGSGPMGDLPVTALVRTTRGDLYAGTDFGVLRLPSGTSAWVVAGTGLPAAEVAGLTLVNGSHVLYAATHGRSVWSLKIP
jgi:hypothetical protein